MLYVTDLLRMKEFYQQVLRAETINTEWTDVWALFDTGGTQFSLHAIPPDIAKEIEILTPPLPRESNPVKLIFCAQNVAAERQRLEDLGVIVLQRPWQGDQECDFVDPEGNVFQIAVERR
ncbi:MAG: glyoxalase/bleomycin resistance/dioxygenase family protein [Bryobacter sp.]